MKDTGDVPYKPGFTRAGITHEQVVGNGTGKNTAFPDDPPVIPEAFPPINTMPFGNLYQNAELEFPPVNELISGIWPALVPTFLVDAVPRPRAVMAALTKAVVASCVVFVPGAGVGPAGVPVNDGLSS